MSHEDEAWFAHVVGVAAKWHGAQVDKAGEPYIEHLKRTAAILVKRFPNSTRAEIEAAVIHDIFEDTEASAAALASAGVSSEAIAFARELTKPTGTAGYQGWIHWLMTNASTSALRIKLADNADNRDPRRVAKANSMNMVLTKYEPAANVLEAELAFRANVAAGLVPDALRVR